MFFFDVILDVSVIRIIVQKYSVAFMALYTFVLTFVALVGRVAATFHILVAKEESFITLTFVAEQC